MLSQIAWQLMGEICDRNRVHLWELLGCFAIHRSSLVRRQADRMAQTQQSPLRANHCKTRITDKFYRCVQRQGGVIMKNDFIEKFVCGDNLPENISQRESIIMEARASLLIEAHFGSERFPAFLSKRDPGRILHISPKEGDPRPLKFHDGVISGETSAFELTPPSVSSKEQTAL